MQKLDRLGWAAGASFVSHGVRLGIRTNSPSVLDAVPAYLPPGAEPAADTIVDRLYSLRIGGEGARPGIRSFHLLYGGIARLARSHELIDVLASLESDAHTFVAEACPD